MIINKIQLKKRGNAASILGSAVVGDGSLIFYSVIFNIYFC